jgi:hypothetical protein
MASSQGWSDDMLDGVWLWLQDQFVSLSRLYLYIYKWF